MSGNEVKKINVTTVAPAKDTKAEAAKANDSYMNTVMPSALDFMTTSQLGGCGNGFANPLSGLNYSFSQKFQGTVNTIFSLPQNTFQYSTSGLMDNMYAFFHKNYTQQLKKLPSANVANPFTTVPAGTKGAEKDDATKLLELKAEAYKLGIPYDEKDTLETLQAKIDAKTKKADDVKAKDTKAPETETKATSKVDTKAEAAKTKKAEAEKKADEKTTAQYATLQKSFDYDLRKGYIKQDQYDSIKEEIAAKTITPEEAISIQKAYRTFGERTDEYKEDESLSKWYAGGNTNDLLVGIKRDFFAKAEKYHQARMDNDPVEMKKYAAAMTKASTYKYEDNISVGFLEGGFGKFGLFVDKTDHKKNIYYCGDHAVKLP